MRALAILATLAAALGLGLAAQHLRLVLQAPADGGIAIAMVAGDAVPPDAVADNKPAPGVWPAVFGQVQKPEPQPPAPELVVVESVPPMPPAPPLDSLGYKLEGMVSTGDDRWAIVAHPTGVRLLRVGDALGDGLTVEAIDARGLWVVNGDGKKDLLKFPE